MLMQGIYLINVIREELPEIFDEDTQNKIYQVVKESIEIEAEILDWIFSDGEIKNINKKDLLNFMKFRVDESLERIGMKKVFHVSDEEYKPMMWFEEEVFANSLDDFFAKRPVEYTKHDKSITADDLF
jgi:ribonucleoside-diphosphate reductase beta chain